jgi:nicotinamidase/pyrazinamidase
VPSYDASVALIVVDVQNDLADPDGSLYVPGAKDALTVVVREIGMAREAGALVICTLDRHPPTTPHFAKDGGIWPVHCVGNTWGAELHPALPDGLAVLSKGEDGGDGYSGFGVRHPGTGATGPAPLVELLRVNQVERLVVCGLATDYSVVETVVDARMLGYPVQVLEEGIRAVDRSDGDGERALTRMREAGAEVV